jgi:hypothetical protein
MTDLVIGLVALVLTCAAVAVIRRRPVHPPLPGPRGGVLEEARPPDVVVVRRDDLEYLLGHYWDEVRRAPDPGHWRLPLLEDAARRLAEASRRQLPAPDPKD